MIGSGGIVNTTTIHKDQTLFEKMDRDGFVKIRFSENLHDLIVRCRLVFYEVFNTLAFHYGSDSVQTDRDVINLFKQHPALQRAGYYQLKNLPVVAKIACHDDLLLWLYKLGLKFPSSAYFNNIRCDLPVKEQNIFQAHQDYIYNFGSYYSLTVWISLQDTTRKEGALRVIPGSHKRGILPHTEGLVNIDEYNQEDFISCEVELGEALVFNQLLIHSSGINASKDTLRFSLQIRYNDLSAYEYLDRQLYFNYDYDSRYRFATPEDNPVSQEQA